MYVYRTNISKGSDCQQTLAVDPNVLRRSAIEASINPAFGEMPPSFIISFGQPARRAEMLA